MGRGKKGQMPKLDWKTWDIHKPIPFLDKTLTRSVAKQFKAGEEKRTALVDSRKALQPLLKNMLIEERKEKHLLSSSKTPIPIPRLEILSEKEYSELYPSVYSKMPTSFIAEEDCDQDDSDSDYENVNLTKKDKALINNKIVPGKRNPYVKLDKMDTSTKCVPEVRKRRCVTT